VSALKGSSPAHFGWGLVEEAKLASGMSEAEILRDFPDLTREDILACLAFAADRERKLVSIPPV
jgi:uncharacterized protein (DUF433 family)